MTVRPTLLARSRKAAAGLSLSLVALLAGCGGGSEGGATIQNLSATNLVYSGRLLVNVSGRLLTQGAALTADRGCDNPSAVAGGTDEAMQFSCTLTVTGNLALRIRNGAGDTIGSLTIEVPNPQVTLVTSSGTIVVELDPTKAKATVDNFLAYIAASFYTNVLFHRVVNDVGIQAGGYLTGPKLKIPNRDPIALESNNGLKNLRGTIAMWHLDGQPASANAQFFINSRDNPDFDFKDAANPGYAVFGTVVTGLDVVDTIKAVPTTTKTIDGASAPLTETPITEVKINTARQSR